eukprot:TRINITY_DN2999_c3_g1_i1.p1 TRINITY_DN2999_c3_g1~~TRINITY_DN2999_c3_g1_i1.p1  ORF type:complete len:1160 (+),score=247.44 TRINITY_DN2999_c3_g1_i1:53-3532(+)
MDFLGGDNRCGQQLLKLVSRGSSIIAELNRLSENIPPVFLDVKKSEYAGLVFDFAYLNDEDKCEGQVQNNPALLEKDEEFRETHMDILQRFYLLFESIWKYITDLQSYWEDVREGFYIQQTFESILVNQDGKQLMAEALYLYGVILLQIDVKIPGRVRERMLISYLRYKGSSNVANLDDVVRLMRHTGFSKERRPAGYPEEYFARIPIPVDICDMIIGRIRSDDIYQMSYNFPAPEQRSTALATQAGMLYVLLYFRPKILHDSKPVMREIVDKHFPDNWIISYYMGTTVDLTVGWAPYKAATRAIQNTMALDNIEYYQRSMVDRLHNLKKEVNEYLREGVLNEKFVLDEIHSKLLPCVRNCNVTLRWFMLHETTQDKKLKALVTQGVTLEDILMLLLNTSQLEYLLQEMFTELIKTKSEKWDELRETGRSKMDKLSQHFGGEGALAAEVVEETLSEWFENIANRIDDLDYENSTQAGRKIQNLIQALVEVEEYHQVDSNLQVRQFLLDTRAILKQMIRYVNIEDRVVITVSTMGDFSYGWNVINGYVPLIQQKIKKSPSLVMQLRSTFLKLATMMELPLTRIAEARSLDYESASEFYSSNLVEFVRKVLAIIPSSMFEELKNIIEILTNVLQECPTRLPRDKMKEFAQLDQRYDLAKTTYNISKFTEGILAMEKTLMGVIQIDPQKLLEEGVRKELVDRLSVTLHNSLQFNSKDKKAPTFEQRLDHLSRKLQGMKSSFEYVQDYMNVYGLKLWQEEFSRLINFNVEMEANNYLTKKIYSWQSQYQSLSIPIPKLPLIEGERTVNFMGRLVNELLKQTDSRRTVYVDQLSAWYDERGRASVCLQTFGTLHSSIGTPGMAGCDKLLAFMIVKDLQILTNRIIKRDFPMEDKKCLIEKMSRHFQPVSSLPRDAKMYYHEAYQVGAKLWPAFLDKVMRIGRCQLLRKHIGKELQFACKLDSQVLHSALSSVNDALLNDIHGFYIDPEAHRYPNGRKPILPELTKYLDNCGMSNPYTQIYITTEPITHLTFILALFVITFLPRFAYDPQIDCLVVRRKEDPMDGAPFIIGLVTILKQFHSQQKDVFVAYLCQYCRVVMNELENAQAKMKEKDKEVIPIEVCNCILFLETFCNYAAVDRKQVENLLPPYLITKVRDYANKGPARK